MGHATSCSNLWKARHSPIASDSPARRRKLPCDFEEAFGKSPSLQEPGRLAQRSKSISGNRQGREKSGHDWRLWPAVLADRAAKSQLTTGGSTSSAAECCTCGCSQGHPNELHEAGDVTLAIISASLQTRDYRKCPRAEILFDPIRFGLLNLCAKTWKKSWIRGDPQKGIGDRWGHGSGRRSLQIPLYQ